MLVLGIFFIICGFLTIETDGMSVILIGIVLLIIELIIDYSKNSVSLSIEDKLSYIINYFNFLYDSSDINDKIKYSKQINYYKELRENLYRITNAMTNKINTAYAIIKKEVDDFRTKTLEEYDFYYSHNEECPLAVDGEKLYNLRKIIENTTDMGRLNVIYDAIRFLILVNNDLKIAKVGYSKYNMLEGMPKEPNKIHVEAFQLLMTKIYLDDEKVLNFLCTELFTEELFSRGVTTGKGEVNNFFDKLLKKVKNTFEKNVIEEIIPILIIVDPTYMKDYNPNKNSYEILGLTSNATKEEVEKAYKKLLITNHPDRGGDEQRWVEINEAYIKIKNGNNEFSSENEILKSNKMTCDNCGTFIDDDTLECPKCGTKIK